MQIADESNTADFNPVTSVSKVSEARPPLEDLRWLKRLEEVGPTVCLRQLIGVFQPKGANQILSASLEDLEAVSIAKTSTRYILWAAIEIAAVIGIPTTSAFFALSGYLSAGIPFVLAFVSAILVLSACGLLAEVKRHRARRVTLGTTSVNWGITLRQLKRFEFPDPRLLSGGRLVCTVCHGAGKVEGTVMVTVTHYEPGRTMGDDPRGYSSTTQEPQKVTAKCSSCGGSGYYTWAAMASTEAQIKDEIIQLNRLVDFANAKAKVWNKNTSWHSQGGAKLSNELPSSWRGGLESAIHNDEGLYSYSKRNFQKARDEFSEATKQDPTNAAYHYNLAEALYQTDSLEASVEQYGEAIRLNPAVSQYHFDKGSVLYEIGKFDEAGSEAEDAIRLAPQYASYHSLKGRVLMHNGDCEAAVKEFDLAVSNDPKYAWYHYLRGNALRKLGRYQEAIAEYNEATGLDPKDPAYHNAKGLAFYDAGKYTRAVRSYERAIKLDPTKSAYHANIAHALSKLGNLGEASKENETADKLKGSVSEH